MDRNARLTRIRHLRALALGGILCFGGATAEDGVFSDRILLGQSAALEGPAAELGRDFSLGLNTAFAEANRAGGVNGRRLDLIARDDGYEPTRAIANTNALLDEDGVFALIGEVGTPTSRAVVPITEERGVPFIAPFTGAEFLRDPKLETVVNLRASYNQETERGVDYLVSELGLQRVAVLFQDDTFGRDGLEGVTRALARRGLKPVADATYKRNTTAVKRAALDLRGVGPEAVFIIGAYEPAAEFIRVSRSIGFEPRFIALSFVGAVALAGELGPAGRGVLITQVMPPFSDGGWPLVDRFHQALARFSPEVRPSFVVLEGYAAGRLAIETLQRLGEDPTRSGFLDLIRSGELEELDGLDLHFSPDSNQGSDAVFLTAIGSDGALTDIAP